MTSQIEALISAITLLQKQNCSLIASTTVLAYDIFSTFPEEVQFIWKAKWSFPKILYILARYYGLFYLSVQIYISTSYDVPLHVLLQRLLLVLDLVSTFPLQRDIFDMLIARDSRRFGDILFTTFVNMLFSLRMAEPRITLSTNIDQLVLAFFIALCIAEYGTEFYTCFISARDAVKTAFLPPPGVPLPGCFTVGLPERLTLIAWIPNLVVNSIFFCASLVKLVTWSEDNHLLSRARAGQGRTLFFVCLRDGAIYYLLTMSSVVINMATALSNGGRWNVLTSSWLIAAYSFAGTHVILNLRSVGQKEQLGANITQELSDTLRVETLRFRSNEGNRYPRVPGRPSSSTSYSTTNPTFNECE
ncbi:hypothetical protein D9613_010970 [Agrocybe pediades]|uniref:DUF6533 domain-containing protein n=1 Tax=Agrocybe pediades TaxID=84607 RepID=A0A8H4QLG4_9AGAR|nr:hypothetical protein D9613_010970 [Agrocybe pediades]